MANTVLQEIEIINTLILSIINEGKIQAIDSYSDPFPIANDRKRVEDLESLMNKYKYGWYIATEPFKEQIKSLIKFQQYIINFHKKAG